MFYIIQLGQAVLGEGNTLEAAKANAEEYGAKFTDNETISAYSPKSRHNDGDCVYEVVESADDAQTDELKAYLR